MNCFCYNLEQSKENQPARLCKKDISSLEYCKDQTDKRQLETYHFMNKMDRIDQPTWWYCGFDIHPKLEPTEENKATYKKFIDQVIQTYKDTKDELCWGKDGYVLSVPGEPGSVDNVHVRFVISNEQPRIPANPERCDYFMRCYCKVMGEPDRAGEQYVWGVRNIAKKYFGPRVHSWTYKNKPPKETDKWLWAFDDVDRAEWDLKDLEKKRREAEAVKQRKEGVQLAS